MLRKEEVEHHDEIQSMHSQAGTWGEEEALPVGIIQEVLVMKFVGFEPP